MRTTLCGILTCCVALVCLAPAALADDRKDIDALYGKLTKLILQNKPEGTLALETADFKSKGRDGKVINGKQLVAQMRQESAKMKLKSFDIKLKKCAVKGKAAHIETTYTLTSEMVDTGGMMGPKGKKHEMAMTGIIISELAKTAGVWKFKYMEEKAGTMTLDGKPFDPRMMGGPPPPKKTR